MRLRKTVRDGLTNALANARAARLAAVRVFDTIERQDALQIGRGNTWPCIGDAEA